VGGEGALVERQEALPSKHTPEGDEAHGETSKRVSRDKCEAGYC
jgi:hypothetical protein